MSTFGMWYFSNYVFPSRQLACQWSQEQYTYGKLSLTVRALKIEYYS